jgi:adenosylmethionine-8-amino-7-oxononanoate aminotransferase
LRDTVYQTLLDAGPDFTLHSGFTYSGHPVACAAALANLDILEREDLIARARKLAPYLERRLAVLRRHPIVGDIRSAGLMAAIELVRDRATKTPFPPELAIASQVRSAALTRGIIVRMSGDIVAICPPLIIKEKEIDLLVSVLDEAIEEVGKQGNPVTTN